MQSYYIVIAFFNYYDQQQINDVHFQRPLKRKSVFDEDPHERRNSSIRRMAIGIGLIVGIGIILWGGYSLFSSKVKTNPNAATASTTSEQGTQRTSTYLHNTNDPQKKITPARLHRLITIFLHSISFRLQVVEQNVILLLFILGNRFTFIYLRSNQNLLLNLILFYREHLFIKCPTRVAVPHL